MYEKHAPKIQLDEITTAEELILEQLAAITYASGDLLYFNGSDITNLGIGSAGQSLVVSGGMPSWQDIAAHADHHAVGGSDTVFPADPGADRYLMWDYSEQELVWVSPNSVDTMLLVDGTRTGATGQAQVFSLGVKASNLTAGRMVFAGTAGLLTDDAGFTYDAATDTLTAT